MASGSSSFSLSDVEEKICLAYGGIGNLQFAPWQQVEDNLLCKLVEIRLIWVKPLIWGSR